MNTIKRKSLKTAVGRRPKPLKPDQDSRAAILKAARSVFARRGFEGASTREVAEVARVNNAMIYYHFKDKVELYRAVLADSFTAFDRIWEHEMFRSQATTREKIQKYIEEFIRFQHGNEELRRIMSMEFAGCTKNTKWLADNYFVHSYEKLVKLLKEGMKRGELKKIDPAMAIPSLVGMIIHSFIMRPIAEHVTGKKLDLTAERFGKFVTGMFFEGLCCDEGTIPFQQGASS
jgi:TetR/AcrR family transcriptional regulator